MNLNEVVNLDLKILLDLDLGLDLDLDTRAHRISTGNPMVFIKSFGKPQRWQTITLPKTTHLN